MAAMAFIAFIALAIVSELRLVSEGTQSLRRLKKKAVSKIATGRLAKVVVFRGSKVKTTGGLSSTDLIKNSRGRIVSKKQSLLAKKRFASGIKGWMVAVQKARKALGLKGFVAIKKGTPLYNKAREFYQ
jgi:hypothetical protein